MIGTRPVVYLVETTINQNCNRSCTWKNAESTAGVRVPTDKGDCLNTECSKYKFN